MIGLCFIFWGTSLLFSVASTPIYVPPNSVGGSCFSTSSPTLVISCLFDKSHSDGCEVISHCGFYCICLMISDVEHLFIYLLAICVSSLNNVHSYLLPIFWLGSFFYLRLSCMSSLYILDISPLSDTWFVNIFFSFVDCLFSVLMVVFVGQKIFLFGVGPIFLFFCSFGFWHLNQNNHQDQCQGAYLFFLLEVLLFQILCSSL